MSTTVGDAPGSRAMLEVVEALEAAGIPATRDPGAFYPQPVGVLVTLAELVSRTHRGRTFTVPVLVVSGDPLNSGFAADRLYAIADDAAAALGLAAYRPSSYRSSVNAEPLPALELVVTVTVSESEV